MLYELIGYAASLMIAISMMMKSVLKLRIINTVGSLLFTIYGVVIGAWPVALMNAFIVGINLTYLWKMARTRSAFAIVTVRPDGEYLRHFFAVHHNEIAQRFPDAPTTLDASMRAWLILRDALPVGLVLGQVDAPGTLRLHVDYVIPGYRDYKPGDFFYTEHGPQLRAEGIRRVCAPAPHDDAHRRYLQRMGFAADEEGTRCRTLI